MAEEFDDNAMAAGICGRLRELFNRGSIHFISDQSGISIPELEAYAKGKKLPLVQAYRIANATETPLLWLVGGEEKYDVSQWQAHYRNARIKEIDLQTQLNIARAALVLLRVQIGKAIDDPDHEVDIDKMDELSLLGLGDAEEELG